MKRIRSYNKALSYMFSQLPMFQRQGKKAFKKDLSNIIALCNKIGNPHRELKAIHIAGTNGKGTVSHFIAGGLIAQGYNVGIYTSPHYADFRERIKINGSMIPKNRVVYYINEFINNLEEVGPSFFELTVAMAFKYFADENVDFAVIETGLGGRLDSTNIITPLVSVITNISYDHTFFLGDSLKLIAGEKAGIIKPNVPVVIGEKQEEISNIFTDRAKELKVRLLFASDRVEMVDNNVLIDKHKVMENVKPDIVGPFVERNLITSVATLTVIKDQGVHIDWNKVNIAFSNVSTDLHFIGRWQWIGKDPDILADSAHNPGGLKVVMDAIRTLDYKHLHFVLGFVKDKELDKVLKYFPETATYYYAKANIPRGLNPEVLKKEASHYGLIGKSYSSVRKALAAARTKCKPGELIYVGGSIFTVAEVL